MSDGVGFVVFAGFWVFFAVCIVAIAVAKSRKRKDPVFPPAPQGTQELSMESGTGKSRSVMWVLTVVVNGFSWFMLYGLAHATRIQGSAAVAWLMLSAFSLFGLLLLWGLVADYIAAGNFSEPVVRVKYPAHPGDVVPIRFIQGVRDQLYLRKITLKLEHVEKYVVGSGKHRRTVTNELHSDERTYDVEVLCSPGQQFDFTEEFTLPETGVPTMKDSNNHDFLWRFEVRVDVKNSPDYHAVLPLIVSPRA